MINPKLLFLSVIFAAFASCREGMPTGVLSQREMEDVLVDYHLAEAMAEQQPGDREENTYLFVSAALRKHGVSREVLDSSLVYWCRNSEKFKEIYLNVYKRLDVMAQDQGVEHQELNRYSNLKTEGDTANIWTLKTHAMLLQNELDNIYSFSIDADTTYHPGDNLMWAFETMFFPEQAYNEAFALLKVKYDNDSIAGLSQCLRGSGLKELRFVCPAKFQKHSIRNISGNIYIPVRKDGFACLAVKDLVIVRYHAKYNVDVQEGPKLVSDSVTESKRSGFAVKDSSVRLAPHQIRGDRAKHRTIDIVKEKPIRVIRRRR